MTHTRTRHTRAPGHRAGRPAPSGRPGTPARRETVR
jgi:hypothetical protein